MVIGSLGLKQADSWGQAGAGEENKSAEGFEERDILKLRNNRAKLFL